MKRFISFLAMATLLATSMPFSAIAITSYDGPADSNAYADEVISVTNAIGDSYADDSSTQQTENAEDPGTDDVTIGRAANNALYIGFASPFDGVAIDISTPAAEGKYTMQYYNGSDWEAFPDLADSNSEPLTSGVMSFDWEIPSDWESKTVNMLHGEDGGTPVQGVRLYYVRLYIDSAYSRLAKASQVGVLKYNAKFELQEESGSAITGEEDSITFTSTGMPATIHSKRESSTGLYEYALYAAESTRSFNYAITVDGYVKKTGSISVSDTLAGEVDATLDYSYVATVTTASGTAITSATVKAGDDLDITCSHLGSGRYGCVVPITETDGDIQITASGYYTSTTTFTTTHRDANSDAQVTQTFALLPVVSNGGNGGTTNYADLLVTDIHLSSDNDLTFDVENQGSVSVPSNKTVLIYVYVDNTRVWSKSYNNISGSSSFLDASGDDTISAGANLFDNFNDGDNVKVEVFVDATNVVTESSDGNNAYTEYVNVGEGNATGVDLRVTEITLLDNSDVQFVVENRGDDDVASSENVYVYVYIEGDRVWSKLYNNSSSTDSFLDAGEEDIITAVDSHLEHYDDGQDVDVEVCVDALDTVNEESETNNCMSDEITFGDSTNSDEVDLEVTDLYTDDNGDLEFVLENTGDQDVESGVSVYTRVYVDGTLEWSNNKSQSSNEENAYLDSDGSTTINVDNNIFDGHGDQYTVEVCVDSTDVVDENDEDNNCMEEDEEELADGPYFDASEGCGDFMDIDENDTFATEYICHLFERGTVDGRTDYLFMPNEEVTRAEFLKMVLEDAGLDIESISGIRYSDVSAYDWYYPYITYATGEDYVEGYANGYFYPNNHITRAEAVVILMRVADETIYDVNDEDISFWDVDDHDWFAGAVVLADEYNLISGYSNGSFGPNNDLTRAEASKIIDLAYDEFYAN